MWQSWTKRQYIAWKIPCDSAAPLEHKEDTWNEGDMWKNQGMNQLSHCFVSWPNAEYCPCYSPGQKKIECKFEMRVDGVPASACLYKRAEFLREVILEEE